MKEVILSSDNEAKIYLVLDEVANNLEKYCLDFAKNWLWKSPHAAKYRKESKGYTVVSYDAVDFIDYLNKWIFPMQPSILVRGLGCYHYEIPKEYTNYPQFNF